MDSFIVIVICFIFIAVGLANYIGEIKSQYEEFIKILKANGLKAKQEKRFFKRRLIEKIEKEKQQ